MLKYIKPLCIVALAIYLDGIIDFIRAYYSDFYPIILGAMPNFIAALFLPLAYFAFKGVDIRVLYNSYAILIGLLIYETLQYFMLDHVFDYYDLLSTILGEIAFVIIFNNTKLAHKSIRNLSPKR